MAKSEAKAVSKDPKAPKAPAPRLSREDVSNMPTPPAEPQDSDTDEDTDVDTEDEAPKAPAPKKAKAPAPVDQDEEVEDYLQIYQVRKVSNGIAQGSRQSNPIPGSKAAAMKAHLLRQDKVKIFLPKGDFNEKVPFTVNLNGYRLDFPRNTYISVPEQIAENIVESLQQTETALKQFRVDTKEKEDALSK